MTPDLKHSDQVAAQVVAWHNRHPLAERISAAQVHSVGVVSLPFAVQGAQVETVLLPPPASAAPENPALPTPNPAPATAGPGIDIALDGAAPQPASAQAEADPAPPIDLFSPVRTTRSVLLPPRPESWHPLTWWARLRGREPFRPLFSEDFIAPLKPRRVARFAAAHGVSSRPLEPEAPQRQVVLDPQIPPPDAGAPAVDLHLITAAVGVGDARVRVLLGPAGPVLGPRHWSRARLAAAAAPTLLLLLGVLSSLWWPGAEPATPPLLAAAPLAASAPAAAASAASIPAPPTASAPEAASSAGPTPPAAPASTPVLAATPAASEAARVLIPNVVKARQGAIDMPPLVRRLSSSDRQALREAGRNLRNASVRPGAAASAPASAPAKVWALATHPAGKRLSDRAAAQLLALALVQQMPQRAEVLHAATGWRAVFWPFSSAAEAEKVRLALADKGLRTELIEF